MYQHTQQSPLHILLYAPAIVLFFVAWQLRDNTPPSALALLVAFLLVVFALSFQTLTVKCDDETLDVHYGPINLFGTRIQLSEINDVRPGQSSWIDGWGIHFIPFRGWTLNLWGFECVEIQRGKNTIRIGTDDSHLLARHLQEKCGLKNSDVST